MKLKDLDIRSDEALIKYGNDFFDRSAKAKRKHERQWIINILYIAGDQLCWIDKTTGRIERIDPTGDPEWMVRVVDNRILPVFRTMVAKLTKNKPLPMVTAGSGEDKDIQAARAVTKLITNHWSTLELDENHMDLVGWLVSTGNGFYKQFYNPNKGSVVKVDEDIHAAVRSSLVEEGKMDEATIDEILAGVKDVGVPQGDTDLVFRNPFCCYPEPGKSRISKMSMFGDSEFITPDEAYDKYKIVVEPKSKSDRQIYSVNVGDITTFGELEININNELVEVRELYIKPNRKLKKGLTYKWIDNQMVEKKEGCPNIPFTHFGLIRIPGSLWCTGLVTDIIPLQKRWNELLSKIEMHNDLYNDPPMIIDPNVIDIEEWVAEPGIIIEKKITGSGADEPYVMPVPALDQSIFQELDILDKQFEIVPVLNKVSFGKDTPNARSGLAINYLQEKDDDVLWPIVNEIEIGYTKVFKSDFKLCQENYEEDRGFAIVGKNNQVEWVDFLQTDLNSNVNVRVEPGSAMPRSVAAQQATVLELMDRGFFNDPKTGQLDYVRASHYLEFGAVDEMYEDLTIDSNQAKRFIDKAKSGEQIIVADWYNHAVHLAEINRFRKTTTYEELPDEMKIFVDDYAAQCLMYLQPPQPVPGAAPSMGEEVPEAPMAPADSSSSVDASGALPVIPEVPAQVAPVQEAAPVEMPADGELPLDDEGEVRKFIARFRKIKPELWDELKDLPEEQSVAIVQKMMEMAKNQNSQSLT